MGNAEKKYLWVHESAFSRLADDNAGDADFPAGLFMVDTEEGALFRTVSFKAWLKFEQTRGGQMTTWTYSLSAALTVPLLVHGFSALPTYAWFCSCALFWMMATRALRSAQEHRDG